MSRRSRSREVALQILFQDDLNPADPPNDALPFLRQRLNQEDLLTFSAELISGVRQHRAALDNILANFTEHWSVSRMATTDRNILRLAAFEMLFLKTPHRIAMDEAIELSKRFGTSQSSQFINGILDRVWREAGDASQNESASPATEVEPEGQKPSDPPAEESQTHSNRSS